MTTPSADPFSAIAAAASSRALKPGTQLRGEFELGAVLHDGEFGISYLATELFQGRNVVVREYLPSALAERASGGAPDVVAKPGSGATAFDEGLRGFVHEARVLVGFELPGLISVLRLWKEHGTAYMALQHVEGVPLRQLIAQRNRAPDEAELREWLRRPLETLERLHATGCVHGNITPDTLLITSAGPVLLGFGGGRHAIGRSLRDMPAVLSAGHAAVEQYAPDPDAALGPWTDLYALASLAYMALTGRPPVVATERRAIDSLVPLRELLAGRYSASLLQALDAALAVWPGARPQNIASFRALLDQPVQAPPAPHGFAPPVSHAPVRADAAAAQASSAVSSRSIAMLGGITAVCVIAFGVIGYLAIRPTDGLTLPAEPPRIVAPQEAPAPRNAQPSADTEQAPVPVPVPVPAPSSAAPPVTTTPDAALPSPVPAPEAVTPQPAAPTPTTAMPVRAPRATAPAAAQARAQPPTSPASAVARRATPNYPARAAQRASCTALLDRAAVQPLTHDEVESVKTECR